MPPEQRARVSEGMRRWHASMTDEEREDYAVAQQLAHMPGMWAQNRHRVVTPFVKGHPDMSTPDGITKMQHTKAHMRSVAQMIIDAITKRGPEGVEEIIERELAGPRALFALKLA